MKRSLLLLLLVGAHLITGCDTGARTLAATEHGVLFRRLPHVFGGGLGKKVVAPGTMVFIWPWDSLERISTSVREVSWGGDPHDEEGYLRTRGRDGNELALALTVSYRVSSEPSDLVHLVHEVGATNEKIDALVIAIARSDIRHYFNELRTIDFIDAGRPQSREKAIERLTKALQEHLSKYYIHVEKVNLDQYRFERRLTDGTVDDTYQETLDQIQRIAQDTEREEARISTVAAEKQQKFNEAQGEISRLLAEVKGEREQAEIRGNALLKSRENDAQAILVKGRAEAEGLAAKIHALGGSGGKSLVKLEVARALKASKPSFAVVDSGSSGTPQGNSLAVSRIDTGEVLSGLGVFEVEKQKARVVTPEVRPDHEEK
jgi:regulator of protease activity HflC (stomatin/prohibitin superfamily)